MGQVLTIMAAFPSAFPRTDYPMSYEEPGVHRLLVAAWQRSRRWERLAEEGELADGVNLELLALAMFDYTLWMNRGAYIYSDGKTYTSLDEWVACTDRFMNMAYKRACTKLAAEGAVPAVWLKVKVLKISRFALNLTFWDALPPERKKTLGWKPPRITESDEYQLNRVLLREGEKMKSVGSRR